jgi:hypothetical protein
MCSDIDIAKSFSTGKGLGNTDLVVSTSPQPPQTLFPLIHPTPKRVHDDDDDDDDLVRFHNALFYSSLLTFLPHPPYAKTRPRRHDADNDNDNDNDANW